MAANKQPTLEAAPPVLALFRAGPLAILRIHDLAFSDVVSSVVRALPPGVTSLMLVTPTDTKMFNLSNGKASYATKPVSPDHRSQHQDSRGAAPDAEGIAEDHAGEDSEDETPDPQEEAIRLAVEDEGATQATQLADAQAEANSAETPAARRAALKKLNASAPAGDPCARCGGTGHISVALDTGAAASVACGVCRGQGVIRRFGVRRR